ncbi:hypothetical protein HLB42_18575 (plasmid) [Deinococcus sp. D7000]|nr:hypothetical protein HLB42_18575 [Deinococcus sp. D7000]
MSKGTSPRTMTDRRAAHLLVLPGPAPAYITSGEAAEQIPGSAGRN